MAFDLLLLALALAGVVHGSRGNAGLHVSGVLAIVGGAALAVPLARLTQLVTGAAGEGSAIDGLTLFIGCFAALWLAIHVAGVAVRTGAGQVAPGTSDRVVGGAVGLVHGALVCLALAGVALVVAPSLRAPIQDRPLGRIAQTGVDAVDAHLSAKAPSGPGVAMR